ncbi:MAG: Hsp20/alpha crystallin family protein [Anaerolineae bacterium]
MSLTRWGPFDDLVSLRNAMDRLLEESVVPSWFAEGERPARRRGLRLPVDAYSTDEEIVILAPVPGADPDDVEITLENDTLTIQGEFKAPLENVNYLLNERAYGPFGRTLHLNVPVETDRIEATFENGLLKIVLPKAEEVRPRVIKVKSKKK